MKNLAPTIFRQRLIIEGKCKKPISNKQIENFLSELSSILKMTTLTEPVTHKSEKYGWAGWIHWESSGCHFYAWDKPSPFFSADIYTCKKFDVKTAIKFTEKFFDALEISYKSV